MQHSIIVVPYLRLQKTTSIRKIRTSLFIVLDNLCDHYAMADA